MRTVDFRFDVLRNGVKAAELRQISNPSVRMSTKSEIKSSLSGEFLHSSDIDILSDEIQPVVIINGIEHACGIFAPATVSTGENEVYKTMSIEAYDRCWRVKTTHTETVKHFSAGQNYVEVVKSLLLEAGIALVIATPTSETLRHDREDWDIGTDLLAIVNMLLNEINYNPLWFDNNGYAIVSPKKQLSAADISRTYDSGNASSMMYMNTSVELDLYNAPNVFICVCSNPDDHTPMTAIAVNNNPISPISVIRRGRRISKLYKVNNIASQSALNEYAQLLCQENMLLGEKISVSTAIIPNCGVGEVVAIVDDVETGLCYETEWEMELGPGGAMKHTLEKAVSLS